MLLWQEHLLQTYRGCCHQERFQQIAEINEVGQGLNCANTFVVDKYKIV